jgi:transcription initiation factor TFIIB
MDEKKSHAENPSGQKVRHRSGHVCPECGGDIVNASTSDGYGSEPTCKDCGFVLEDKIIDRNPEWRAFDSEQREKRTRTGAPPTYTIHDKGLSTIIDGRNKDALGRRLPSKQRYEIYRMRKWQRRVRVSDASERNLAIALSEMSRLSSALNLPKHILENASVLYRKILREKMVRGRSIKDMVAAAIYYICRQNDMPRTLDEVSKAASIDDKKRITRPYRYFVNELGLKPDPPSSNRFIGQLCNKLDVSGKTESVALRIYEVAKKMKLTQGRGPTGIAAATTYMATILTNEKKTQREIADIIKVTEVTVRNRYKELTNRLYIEVPL